MCDVGKMNERVGSFCTGCVLCLVPEFFFLWVGVVAVVRIVVRGGNTWLLLLLVLLGGARITAPPKDGFLGEGGTYSWGTTKPWIDWELVRGIPEPACWDLKVNLFRYSSDNDKGPR